MKMAGMNEAIHPRIRVEVRLATALGGALASHWRTETYLGLRQLVGMMWEHQVDTT